MTDRLNSQAPARQKRTAQEWADRGNALLAGTELNSKNEYEIPRSDVRWIVRDGRCVIEMVR